MNKYQKKAWDCLTPTEQQSLFLQLSESKSSLEGCKYSVFYGYICQIKRL